MKPTDKSRVDWDGVAQECSKHRFSPIEPMSSECLVAIVTNHCAYVEYVKDEQGSYFQERSVNDRPDEVMNGAVIIKTRDTIL